MSNLKWVLNDNQRKGKWKSHFDHMKIRRIRDARGYTWDEMAKIMGVSRIALHYWATGKEVPTQKHRKMLCKMEKSIKFLQEEALDGNQTSI